MASLFDGVDLSTIPAGIPPVGVTPNFVNPETREELPKIFIYVTLPPMVVFLSLRIYARIKYSLLGLDDCELRVDNIIILVISDIFFKDLCVLAAVRQIDARLAADIV
jgi:hypothetical protein